MTQTQTIETDYDEQAIKFLRDTDTLFTVELIEHGKHFASDIETRDIYSATFTRGDRSFTVRFGQSIADSGYKVTRKDGKCIHHEEYFGHLPETLKHVKFRASGEYGSLGGLTITEPKAPTAYDILTCLTKSDTGSFEEFCSEFGYDTDSIKAERIYKLVLEEWSNVQRIWTDTEIEKLQEIQ